MYGVPICTENSGINDSGGARIQEAVEAIREALKVSRLAEVDGNFHDAEVDLAEELTDVITVCTSWLHALGYDEYLRGEVQRRVNEKNKKRGYF